MKKTAVIFDMDGTMVHNTPYHYRTWKVMFEKYGLGELSEQTYYAELSGVPILDTIKRLFTRAESIEQMQQLVTEKENIYQELYTPHITPVNGLIELLTELKAAGIKLAIASSASVHDIDFVLKHIHVKHFFDVIVDGSQVDKGKPNPDIFLKAAAYLEVSPENCIVFEDSVAGIKAGNAAGMKVVGIATGNIAEKLQPSALVVNDFAGLNLQKLADLFN